MDFRAIFILYFFISCMNFTNGNQISMLKEAYPFLAYIYYPDDSVVDKNNKTFLRFGILVTPQHVVSASIDPLLSGAISSSRLTLLAKMGTSIIYASRPLNHDGEQEREVIQIMRPHNHSPDTWWLTDITVLKLQEPFTISDSVALTQLNKKCQYYAEDMCYVLFFAESDENRPERTLEKIPLRVVKTPDCGKLKDTDRTICTVNVEPEASRKITAIEYPKSTASPLICKDGVVALQSVSKETNCKFSQTFISLSCWEDFIHCCIKTQCSIENCKSACITTPNGEPRQDMNKNTTPNGEPRQDMDKTTTPNGELRQDMDKTTTPNGELRQHMDKTTTPNGELRQDMDKITTMAPKKFFITNLKSFHGKEKNRHSNINSTKIKNKLPDHLGKPNNNFNSSKFIDERFDIDKLTENFELKEYSESYLTEEFFGPQMQLFQFKLKNKNKKKRGKGKNKKEKKEREKKKKNGALKLSARIEIVTGIVFIYTVC